MGRFLKNILVFSLLMIAGLFCCELYVRTRPNDIVPERVKLLDKYGNRIEALYLGTSLTFWGISPDTVNITEFNLAFNSQLPDPCYYILKSQINKMPNLKKVYLEIAPFTPFDGPLEDGLNWTDWTKNTLYYNTDKHSKYSIYGFEIFYPQEFRRKLLPWSKPWFTQNETGHATHKPRANRIEKWKEYGPKVIEINAHPDPKEWKWVDYNVEYLEKIIELCRKHGIQVVLVVFPAHKIFRDGMSEVQIAEMYRVINELKAKYHLKLLDFYTDDRFTDDDFHDVMHLSSDVGAAKMTRLLKEADSIP